LASEQEIRPFKGDVVVDQKPQAKKYVPYFTQVEVAVRMETPNVTGRDLREGVDRLRSNDLVPDYRDRYSQFNPHDRIVDQSPEPGELIGHYDSVDLTLKVPVPDTMGMSLSEGKDKLEEWNLQPNVPKRLARRRDTIRGQSPTSSVLSGGRRTRRLVDHGDHVTLDPVVAAVPALVPLERLGIAWRQVSGQTARFAQPLVEYRRAREGSQGHYYRKTAGGPAGFCQSSVVEGFTC